MKRAKCQYAELVAVSGTTLEPCPNQAEYDVTIKAGTYNREFSICEDHADYMMQVAAPAASEIELEANGTRFLIERDSEVHE